MTKVSQGTASISEGPTFFLFPVHTPYKKLFAKVISLQLFKQLFELHAIARVFEAQIDGSWGAFVPVFINIFTIIK